MPIKNTILEAFPGYAIYFDNVRVDQFVKDFTVNLSTDGTFGQANINMIYVPSLDKIVHEEAKGNIVTVKDQESKKSEVKSQTVFKVNYRGTATAALNVRSGPGTGNAKIGMTYPGGDIVVSEEHHTNDSEKVWLKMKYWLWRGGTKEGYVSGRYVRRYDKGPVPSTKPITGSSSEGASNVGTGMSLKVEDGLENMTNVRIFIKNIFTEKYVQVFEGNIRSKSTSIQNNERSFSVQAYDYMNWLHRTTCPIAVPFDGTLTVGDRLKWKAQGIDLNKVKTVQTAADITFKGKNIAQTWTTVSEQTLSANKLYSDPNSVSMFDNALKRVAIMGDIDEKLRKAEVMDFIITNSATQMTSVYVMLNDILRLLMFEFYQDRDGVIRIKPPFWNEHVIMSHVIDKSLIMSYNETTNYSSFFTRAIVQGGIEQHQEDISSDVVKSIITPVVVVTSSGIQANSGPVVVTSAPGTVTNTSADGGSTTLGNKIVATAKKYLGWPYIWGGSSPSQGGFDCSGLIQYAYAQNGISIPRVTYDQVKGGTKVTGSLMAGDLLFSNYDGRGPGHVVMYIGNGQIIEAQKKGVPIHIRATPSYKEARRYLTATSGANSGTNKGNNIVYEKPKSVGPDTLLNATEIERKYGPLVHETTQSLIKFSTSSAAGNSSNAYDALTKYGRFILDYMNSAMSLASIQTVAMPWLRPGFNVWIDPATIDKVFYISAISHFGNATGTYTTLNMTMGRPSSEFTGNKNSLGALKPGNSDNIFVSSLTATPEHFGTKCNYDSVRQVMRNRYVVPNQDTMVVRAEQDSFYKQFYKEDKGTTFQTRTSSSGDSGQKNTGPAQVNYMATCTKTLTVRSGPGDNNSKIGTVYPGGDLQVMEETNGWLKMKYWLFVGGTKIGYVPWAYCKRRDGGPIPSQSQATNEYTLGKSVTGTYNTRASNVTVFDGEYSIDTIKSSLDAIYKNSAPAVVKTRAARLEKIINTAKTLLKPMINHEVKL